VTTSLNPSDKSASITLSNNNLTWQSTGAAVTYFDARSVDTVSGKVYFEWVVNNRTPGQEALAVGIATTSASLTSFPGNTTDSWGYYSEAGTVWFNNAVVTTIGLGNYVGAVICTAWDDDNKLIWIKVDGGNWNNSSTANPATGTGGISVSGLLGSAGARKVIVTSANPNRADQGTLRFTAGTWTYEPPVGFYEINSPAPRIRAIQASVEGRAAAVTSTTSVFNTNPTSGNLLVAWVALYNGSAAVTGTVTDNKSNTWTRRAQQTTGLATVELWTAPVTSTGASFTITATASAGSSQINVVAVEFSGLSGYDTNATATSGASSTSLTLTSGTASADYSLSAIIAASDSGSTNSGYIVPPAYTSVSVQQSSASVVGYIGSFDDSVSGRWPIIATQQYNAQTNMSAAMIVLSVSTPATGADLSQAWQPNAFLWFPQVGGGTVINVSLSETATAAETITVTMTMPVTLAETASALETISGALIMSVNMPETVTANETVTAAVTMPVTVSETASALETITNIMTLVATMSETATAAETITNNMVLVGTVTESGSASDTANGNLIIPVSVSESGSAVDTITGGLLLLASVAETLSASDSPACALSIFGVCSESGTASDTSTANMVMPVSVSETLAAAETILANIVMNMTISEAGNAVDLSALQGATYNVDVAEVASAADLQSAALSIAVNIAESASALDTQTNTATLVAFVAESGNANDTSDASGGGGTTIYSVGGKYVTGRFLTITVYYPQIGVTKQTDD